MADASIGYTALREQDMGGWTRVISAAVHEVSVLSPGTEPADPLSRVTWVDAERSASSPITYPMFGRRKDQPRYIVVVHDLPRGALMAERKLTVTIARILRAA